MNREKYTIAEAFIEAERRDYYEIDTNQVWITSKKFNQSMKRLIHAQKSPIWKYVNTTGKRVAMLAIVFMLLSGCAMSIEAIRTPVVQFVIEVYEKFTQLLVPSEQTENNVPTTIEKKYKPTMMIQGYSLVGEDYDLLYYQLRWSNSTEEEIVFQQSILTNYASIIDTENIPYRKIELSQYDAVYFTSANKHSLIWSDGEYTFKITCQTSIDIDNVIKIADSVSPCDA